LIWWGGWKTKKPTPKPDLATVLNSLSFKWERGAVFTLRLSSQDSTRQAKEGEDPLGIQGFFPCLKYILVFLLPYKTI